MAELTASIKQMWSRRSPNCAEMRNWSSCCVTASTETSPQCFPRSGTPFRSRKSNCRPPPSNTHGAWRSVGTTVNALVRAYRLGHKAVLDEVLDEIGASDLELPLSLAVFSQISEVTFGYVDWITQQVVSTYQSEHDRWMENQNSMRALRVRELLDGADVDIDAVTTAIRYPLRRTHLAIVVWRDDDDGGDDVASMERFVHQLAESAGAESSLFISVDRMTGWAWIPLMADAAPDAIARLRAFAASQTDAPRIAVGNPLPDVSGFRRSHEQAQRAHAVAIASGSNARRVTVASDPGVAAAALMGNNLVAARRLGRRGARTARVVHGERRKTARNTRSLSAHRLQLQGRRRGTAPPFQFSQISRASRDRTSRAADQR